jgi:hypothetical protein
MPTRPLAQPRLDQFKPLDIGLQMQHRALDHQLGGDCLVPGRGCRVQITQRLKVLPPLPIDEHHRISETDRGSDGELHEELVLQPRTRHRRPHPPLQLHTAGVGQAVRTLAATVTGDGLPLDEPFTLQPGESRVDLPGVHGREYIAEFRLNGLLDLVAVATIACQQRHEQFPHR